MKHVKMLGLPVFAALALMAMAGPASATILTSPAGTTYTGAVKLTSEGEISLISEVGQFSCQWSMEGKVESHGAAVTAAGKISTFTMTNCTNANTVKVLKSGSLEFHTDTASADGNGTVTWSGAEFTITYSAFGVNCLYATGAGVSLGTLTGSKTTGTNATVDGVSAKIPRTSHSFFCGEATTLTGNFKVASPAYLDVD